MGRKDWNENEKLKIERRWKGGEVKCEEGKENKNI